MLKKGELNMYLYFGLNVEDLEEFCQLINKEENRGYEVNDEVFIDITDGLFITTYMAKLIHYVAEKGFVIIGFDDGLEKLKPNNRITLKSFKNQNKEIKLKVFNAASNVNIRDNFKYTLYDSTIKSENNTKPDNKQTYYFILTKDDHKCFVYRRYDGTLLIKTAIWNVDHTNFTLENVPVVQVMTVSFSSDLLMFRISDFDSRNFHTSRNSHNAYEKQIYFYESCYSKTVEFFTDLNDCIYFTKTKREEPRITNKLEKQWSWDCKPLNISKEETKMSKIKDIKLNGPATILFTTDNKKVVVKCRPGDDYDPEKGILMALCKYIYNSNTNHNNWTEVFNIPYSDEIDVEKVIAMTIVKCYFYKNDKDWHYNYVLKYMYNAVNLKTEDRVKALKALDYSVERIARCLGVTKWFVKNALDKAKAVKPKVTITGTKDSYIENLLKEKSELKNNANPYEVPDHKPCNTEELSKKQKDVISDQDIIDLFNKGYSISKISKELGLTEYFVKKYLDAYTNPKTEKKAGRILRKALKSAQKEKKDNKPVKHVRRTQIDYPDYLDKETCDMVLERTKEKYKDHDKIQYLSELQKYFIMECKREYIVTHYGNGYDMYTIAKVLGINAASVQRIWNAYKSGKEK